MEEKELSCCEVVCDVPLDKIYWNNRYITEDTKWDLGYPSPPLTLFIDTIENKNAAILIPGCGNAYEVDYLIEKGFTNITVIDIAPNVVEILHKKYLNIPQVKIICADFFELNSKFDYIIEQTFFCALAPTFRQQYVYKMYSLLNENGILAGLLFNKQFEKNPPFGGSQEEYELLFKDAFHSIQLEECTTSIPSRLGTELFIEFKKNSDVIVELFDFDGITCNGCKKTVSTKYAALPKVLNISMSTDYKKVLLVSEQKIDIANLRNEIAYEPHYTINSI